MKKLFVTMPRLRRVIRQVEREIKQLGLWRSELDDVQIYLIPVHIYFGYSLERTGDIYIPRVSIGALLSRKTWSLRDIVRHEYGHALSYLLDGWEDVFVAEESITSYGETNIDEDFAETFRFYLKHKGKLPKRWRARDGIVERWQCLQALTT